MRLVWSLLLFAAYVSAHVRLVFPPSRQPSLDYYSTRNANPPCGVSKPPVGKGVRTFLKSGNDVEIEWFTAIPHMGGIRVEVLNALDQPIAIFTNFLDPYNVTNSKKVISLPPGFECNNCAIRLTHEATEYGPDYHFFTCADVNIVKALPDGDSCLGNGNRVDGVCQCSGFYSGDYCQYESECNANKDCGSMGVCKPSADLPKGQCYCAKGQFGMNCEQSSNVHTSSSEFDPTLYQMRQADENKIFWRILDDEIEFVLKFPGQSWAGLGWKPQDYVCPTPVPQPALYEQKEIHFNHKTNKSSVDKSENHKKKPISAEKELSLENEDSEEIFTESNRKALSTTETVTTERSTTRVSTTTRSTTTFTPTTARISKENNSVEEIVDETTTTSTERPKATRMSTTTTTTEHPTAGSNVSLEKGPEFKLHREQSSVETSSESVNATCGNNEEFSNCPEMSRECEASCDWTRFPETIPNCPRACGEARCVCKPGFVRSSADDNTCVPFNFCDAETEPTCARNSTWAKCGTACEPSCENMYDTSPCPSSCEKPACTCADNYVRYKGECIFWGDCPNLDEHLNLDNNAEKSEEVKAEAPATVDVTMKTPQKTTEAAKTTRPGQTVCPVNETMTECGKICEADCSTIFTREACEHCSEPECACIQGYARLNGQCVYWGDCPSDGGKTTAAPKKMTTPKPNMKIESEKKEKNPVGEQCYGDWRFPEGCKDCDYKLSWNYVDETDEIEFSLETKAPQNWWTGVGFSAGGSMIDADMIIIKSENGKLSLHDMYSSSYGTPTIDASQDVYTPSVVGSHVNGVLRAQFTRKRDTGDKKGDHKFSDTQCYNFLFPVEGGRLDDNGNITIHTSTPFVSENKVCVRSCIQPENEQIASEETCENEFRYPSSCVDTACDYIAKWHYDEDRKDIKFEISSKELGRWTGIGFSKDGQMTNADIYTGWVYEGKGYVTDRFAYGRQLPAIDPADRNDIYEIDGKQVDEVQTISFRRPVVPKDTITDFALDKCYYFLFPIGGGRVLARKSQDFTNPRTPIGYHDLFQPRVSKTKFCICDSQGKKLRAEPTQVRHRRQALAQQASSSSASAMACTDMVVGTVHDGRGRVRDMYSPSKATPRMDSFFDGTDDLTAATAYQEDGVTTVVFRKKLHSTDPADHSFVRGPMTVIWAKGANPNNYQHTTGGAPIKADPEFFADAFKYHGKNQRGVLTIDFFGVTSAEMATSTEEIEIETTTTAAINTPEIRLPPIPDAPRISSSEVVETKSCSGLFTYPRGCSLNECKYAVGWTSDGKKISFHIEASLSQGRWTAVGFSQDGGMANSDVVIISHMRADDEITVTDQFMPNYGRPTIDEQQDIFDVATTYDDGRVYANFSRALKTDDSNDLTLEECQYFLFTPTGGLLEHNGDINKHGDIPITSKTKICLNVCGSAASEDTELEKVTPGVAIIPSVRPAIPPADVSKEIIITAPTTSTSQPKSTIPSFKKSKESKSSEDVRMPPIVTAGNPVVSQNPDAKARYGLRLRILNREFVPALDDPQSEYYRSFTKDVTFAVNRYLNQKWKGMQVSKIVDYSKGSVIVEFEVDAVNSRPKAIEMQAVFEDAAMRGSLTGFSIEPTTVKVKDVEIPKEPMDDTALFGINLDKDVIRNIIIIGVAAIVVLFVIICTCCCLCRRTTHQFSPMRTESMEAKSYSDIPYKADSYPPYPYAAAYGPYGTLPPKQGMAGFENKAYQGPSGTTPPGAHQRHFSQATTASNKGGSSSPAPSQTEAAPDGLGETTYQEWHTKVASKPSAQTHEETVAPPRPPSSQPYVSYPNDPSAYYTLGGEHRANNGPRYFRPY